MKKKALIVLGTLCLLIALSTTVWAYKGISIIVNGEEVSSDVAPFIKDGRTMVPLRVVAESLGAEVDWDPGPQLVLITKPSKADSLLANELQYQSMFLFQGYGFISKALSEQETPNTDLNNCLTFIEIIDKREQALRELQSNSTNYELKNHVDTFLRLKDDCKNIAIALNGNLPFSKSGVDYDLLETNVSKTYENAKALNSLGYSIYATNYNILNK